MSGLSLRKVAVGYGKQAILRDVSIAVPSGKFCALLGLNGSGKTTLLRSVCGLLPLLEGSCAVNGMDCTHLNESKRARYISYIPQRYSKMQGVTVLDALLMGRNPHLGLFESPSGAEREQAKALLDRMGITDLSGRDFARLSEGQKQLAMLARALVQDAPVMLMDEPDSALDFLNRHRMLGRIRDLIRNEGKAGLVTLHDPNFALAYCDRLILLKDGKITAQLELAGASRQQIQSCLSILYGDVEIAEHNGSPVLFMRPI